MRRMSVIGTIVKNEILLEFMLDGPDCICDKDMV